MSFSIQGPDPRLDLGDAYEALFSGAIISALLFGLTNVQVSIYFQTHTSKRITFYKLVVIWLWTLDALHLAFIIHFVYYYLVINYENIVALTEVVWSFKLQLVFDVLITNGIHLLYCHRIWTVSKDQARPFLIVAGIVVVAGLCVDISLVWIIYQHSFFADLAQTKWVIFMAMGTSASLDALIASSLCYLLATSRTGFPRTDSFITKLIHYTIDTGCLTSICSMTVIITCVLMPHSFIFLCFESIVAKLYVNSYIALLNTRHYMQSNADIINSPNFQIHHGDTLGMELHKRDEKLPRYRRSGVVGKHVEDEVAVPARPVQAAMPPPRSILVTVEKERFVDLGIACPSGYETQHTMDS
ncbi:hypothetical protein DFH29DRAFT_47329 [Suillus ampliporus]|nr:hypothetical protein DFH29DRAFT_47329 [Suillus ampliporus]